MPVPSWLDREAFAFEPQVVESLSVVDEGSGPPIVFSHGTPTWSFEWRHLIRGLSGSHRCIAPDHLGFGLSPRPVDGDYSPQAHAKRFSRLIDGLGLTRYTLVAHDFGGPFALDEALNRPERIERLVLFNTFAWSFTDDPRTRCMATLAGSGLFRWLYRTFNFSFVIGKSAWGGGPRPAAMWRQYTSVFPDADSRERVLWALAKGLTTSTPFFQSLWERRQRLAQTPIHFIWGMADSAFPAAVLARFREAWPHATVTELEKAGHWPHEEAPARCLDEVRRFLEVT